MSLATRLRRQEFLDRRGLIIPCFGSHGNSFYREFKMILDITVKHFVDFVFSLGLFFNAVLFIPHAIALFKTKNTEGNSIITFAGFNVMQLFTAWHGYLSQDYLLTLGFLLSFVTCGAVTAQLFWYRKRIELQTQA
jgi:MtN3 and saliva related transmembrane protein